MRRVPEVLDCWFESGSMPFAQVHYPFENADWFEHHYPGDFIVEYNGQTRGWFYTLHVLATALFDRPAFRTCVAHGIVLGDDGAKMSQVAQELPGRQRGLRARRLRRHALVPHGDPDPARRRTWSSPSRASARACARRVLPLWNTWYFLSLYANAAGRVGTVRTDSAHVLDRYVLAKTAALVDEVTAALDVHDIAGACERVRDYAEVLTNWYVRRSRERFWDGDADAIDTLHTVLETTARVAAPLLPLTTEGVWRGLTGGRSVHLTDWPACEQVRDHAEVLTNWYVRRSRERFWDGDADAIDTLHTVLEVTAPGRRATAAADHGARCGRG